MNLTKKQKSAIIGMILGDGYIQKTGSRNARLRLEHQANHYDYIIWKASLIPKFFQKKPNIIERIHPITHKTYRYARLQSGSSPYFGKLHSLFYPNNKKRIPNNLDKLLKDDIAFVIWYYDDGYYYKRDKCCYIYLGKVTQDEADISSSVIRKRFNIANHVLSKKDKGFVLYFSPIESKKIKNILEKYFVPIMAYKIPS